MTGLNDAQLGIYGFLSIPVLYLLYRHGWRGALGWGYLFIFCTLRVIGPALDISDEKSGKSSATGQLISSIGLSPLLLATVGLLHEGRIYRNPKARGFWEWAFVILLHLLTAQALAMIASASSVFKGGNVSSTNLFLVKFGICTMELVWVLLLGWGLFSLLPSQRKRDMARYAEGSKLLYTVLLSLIFTGIRLTYSVVNMFTKIQNLVNGPLGLKIGLSFLPELILVLGFVAVGFMTRNINEEEKLDEDVRMISPTENGWA